MNRTVKLLVLPVMALALTGVPSFAQDHPDHDNSTYRQHSEWKPGARRTTGIAAKKWITRLITFANHPRATNGGWSMDIS